MSRFVLAGHDAAPSGAFILLESALRVRGHEVILHALNTEDTMPNLKELEQQIRHADAVLIGMSTPKHNAILELSAASHAVACGVPFGFYIDTHGAFARQHFAGCRESVSFLFTLSDDESQRAKKVFPRAHTYMTGNPLWAPYFRPANYSDARRLVDADGTHYVILLPGTKDQQHNLIGLDAVLTASMQTPRVRVVFSIHPGDKSDRAPYLERHAHAVRIGLGDKGLTIIDPSTGDKRNTDSILPGVNLVINGVSARTHAIARRIPQIDFFTGYSLDWLEKDIGSRYGYFYGSGAVIDIYGGTPQDLAAAIWSIRSNPNQLCEKQQGVIESVTEAKVLEAMCFALECVVARSQRGA